MATSGTADFNLDLNEIIEEAFDRAGLEVRTGYEWRTARRSLNLMLADWANRGFNMWTVEQGSIPLVQGQYQYDLPNDTVDLVEHVVRTNAGQQSNQTDLTITRISVSTYATIPNKLTQARPIQIYVDRQAPTPNVKLWPVPNQGTALDPYYTLVYWRLRRIDDAGTGINTADVPFRFLPVLTAGLAYFVALKNPELDPNRIGMLKQMYDEAWQLASDEDRDKSPVRWVPRQMYVAGR
jgi:hypothetical protein